MELCENGIRIDIQALQWRQELHDRYYHVDIYNLSKPERLKHLILHQAKYISRICTAVYDYGVNVEIARDPKVAPIDRNFHFRNMEYIRKVCVDGVIVTLSMMNVCNFQFEKFIPLEGVNHANLLIRHMGSLAKTIEDVDHMAQKRPIQDISESCEVLLALYFSLNEAMGGSFKTLRGDIYRRLVEVEEKNIFHSKLSKIIEQQITGR